MLTDLPPELLGVIVYLLRYETGSLLSLCLVGNHEVLHNVRVVMHRVLDWRWTASQDGSIAGPRPEFMDTILASQERLEAAKQLRLVITGDFDQWCYRIEDTSSLYTLLPQFKNLTVLCLTFFGAAHGWGPVPSTTVYSVVSSLPASLTHLHIEGCSCDDRDFYLLKPIPSVKRLSIAFCNPELYEVVRQCHNATSLEFTGGDGLSYWQDRLGGTGRGDFDSEVDGMRHARTISQG